MTLFSEADPTEEIFQKVLNKFYSGKKYFSQLREVPVLEAQ